MSDKRIELLQDDDYANAAHESRQNRVGNIAHIFTNLNDTKKSLEQAAKESSEAYLRSRSYALEANIPPKPVEKKAVKQAEIDAPSELSLMLAELDAIREKSFLFSASDFECYLADYEDVPNLIHEIARLREETFRAIGEGTGKNLDQDEFDSHFKHLILWDKAKQKIVGCYRLGIGSDIVPKYGIKGFYVSTLVNFSESFVPYLEHTIELCYGSCKTQKETRR